MLLVQGVASELGQKETVKALKLPEMDTEDFCAAPATRPVPSDLPSELLARLRRRIQVVTWAFKGSKELVQIAMDFGQASPDTSPLVHLA